MISKNDILGYYFGDMAKYILLKYKMSIAIIVCPLIWLEIYLIVFRRHKKGAKYTLKEKFYIGIAIWMTIMAILFQFSAGDIAGKLE